MSRMISGLGEGEQVVVAGELVVVIGVERAAEVRLAQLVALDHGAHGAIQQQHAPGRSRFERSHAFGTPAFPRPGAAPLRVLFACCRHALPPWPAAHKDPPRLCRAGPNALAAFVKRPQAVAQIGAKAPIVGQARSPVKTVGRGCCRRLPVHSAQRGSAVVDLISSMDSREVMLKIFTCEMSAW